MSIGDLITYVCLAIALWYVPRYILRVYAPGLYARIKLSIENAVRELQARDYARYQAKQAARHYVTHEPVPAVPTGPVPLPRTGIGTIDIVSLADNLTEDEYIELGARLKNRNGKPIYSGKRLYTLAGGNHDEFLAKMRRWRGEDVDAPHVTPIVGRRTSARFETDPDYPYQSPA